MATFHSVLVWCRSVLFCLGRCRIHWLVSFFSLGLFFGLPCFRGFVLSNFWGLFWYTWFFFRVCSKAFLSLVILLISAILRAHFSYSSQGFFVGLLLSEFLSGSLLSSTPYIGLLCLLRMHAINSCVDDTWQRLWRDDFTQNGKQVVNRLKIPQGLSTLMFRRWSEVPLKGRGPRWFTVRKNDLLYKDVTFWLSL